MSANTKIEWADHTFNPWIGCTQISPGCDHCYAKAEWDDRRHRAVWGPGQARSRTKTWGDPVKWDKQHEAFYAQHGRRQRVFCASLADVFDNEVDPQWRADLFDLILAAPNLDFVLLTKRIGNVQAMVIEATLMNSLPSNVWLGATICNQEEADRDIPKLLAVPATKRFLSMEPILEPVNLTDISDGHADSSIPREYWEEGFDTEDSSPAVGHNCLTGERWQRFGEWSERGPSIDWVIVGGESGPGARPMHPDWARSLRNQCQAAGVPFFFKQWGEWQPRDDWDPRWPKPQCAIKLDGTPVDHDDAPQDVGGHRFMQVGKKAAGRLLDGRTWDEVPQ